ncbi:DedA family protein [Brevibacillus fulvus]|uniref:Membrane protein DedA with SNARE-associated domain n=1 Tax=Brevibacillus fulvus TaxID=1125967 RepID=A0A938Y5U4_9BACL|nr:DedA family protein [Brevibacillus fulvus]MBM7592092.1 membrane protein DedA with SNARE-associated domain [Brevibacillus fulvus]
MEFAVLLQGIEHYGYMALYFALWLGIVGMPIPDEVVVMTGGLVTSFQLLDPIPAFLVTYLGVISGLSLGYLLGRKLGMPILERLNRRRKMDRYIGRSQQLLMRYGNYALIFSYFLPVVRHVVPYLLGISNFPFARYALYSYSTGFVWTLLFFLLGRFFGGNLLLIADMVRTYGWYALLAAAVLLLAVWGWVRVRRQWL